MLAAEHSSIQTGKIVNFIGGDPNRFEALFAIFTREEHRLIQRASWAISRCVEKDPKLIDKYYPTLVELLVPSTPDAVKRNITRLLQFVNIPEEWSGYIYERCFAFVSSAREPIAVRCFSMQVIFQIALGIPELEEEVRELLTDVKDLDPPGIRSRSRRLLKKLGLKI